MNDMKEKGKLIESPQKISRLGKIRGLLREYLDRAPVSSAALSVRHYVGGALVVVEDWEAGSLRQPSDSLQSIGHCLSYLEGMLLRSPANSCSSIEKSLKEALDWYRRETFAELREVSIEQKVRDLERDKAWLLANFCETHGQIALMSSGPCGLCRAKELISQHPGPARAIELLVSVRDYSVNESGVCAVCLTDPHSSGCVIELVEKFVQELDDKGEHPVPAPVLRCWKCNGTLLYKRTEEGFTVCTCSCKGEHPEPAKGGGE